MLAHLIHAVDILPFRNPLQLTRRNIPARTCKRLRKHLILSILLRDRRTLPRAKLDARRAAEPVHARLVLVFIEGHHARRADHLSEQIVFLNGMSRQLAVMRLAPVVNLFCEIDRVQLVHQLPIMMSNRLRTLAVHEQRPQHIQQIAAIPFRIRLQNHRRIRRIPSEILRLVRKKALHRLAEIRAESRKVLLMRFVQEFFYDFGIQDVDYGRIRPVVQRNVFLCARIFAHANELLAVHHIDRQRGFIERTLLFARHVVHPIRRILEQLHARKSARPAVFIVAPRIHALFFRFIDARVGRLKPLFAQIFRRQPAARVHEKAADARFFHRTDLPAQLVRLQLIVPAPERNRFIARQILIQTVFQIHLHSSTIQNSCDHYTIFPHSAQYAPTEKIFVKI